MKKCLPIFFVWLLMETFLTAQPYQELPPDGVWYNKHKDQLILIETSTRGLLIKGIHHTDRFSLFEPIGRGVYIDSHKNRIFLDNERKLVYKNRPGTKKLTFVKIESHTPPGIPDHTTYEPPRKAPLLPVEGTWDVKEIDRKVFITETRDGLKARLSDEKEWFTYERSKEDYNIYISQRGSRYEWIGENTMRWISADGKRILTLIKKSDNF